MTKNDARSLVIAIATMIGSTNATAQTEGKECPPGYQLVGGRTELRPDLPPIIIGGECKKLPSPPSKFNPVGPAPVYPSYYLLSILYSIPGEMSELKVGEGSSVGSKTSTSNSYKAGINVEVATNVVDVKTGYAITSVSGNSYEVKTEDTTVFSVSGTSDPQNRVNHDNDVFFLWVNPEIDITQTGATTINERLGTRGGADMQVISVTGAEVKDRSKLAPWKVQALSAITSNDWAAIQSMDPFLGEGGFPSTRFAHLGSLQLDGPDNVGDPVTGQGIEVDSEQTSSTSSTVDRTVSVSIQVGGQVSFVVMVKAMVGVDFEWTAESTNENSSGTLQKYEVKLETANVGFHSVVDLYEDTFYNSVVFVPREPLSASIAALIGAFRDRAGRPQKEKLVKVTLPSGEVRKVLTNARGIYRVFDVSAGPATVRSDGQYKGVVIPKRGQQAVLNLVR